jgi:hypothetical protein
MIRSTPIRAASLPAPSIPSTQETLRRSGQRTAASASSGTLRVTRFAPPLTVTSEGRGWVALAPSVAPLSVPATHHRTAPWDKDKLSHASAPSYDEPWNPSLAGKRGGGQPPLQGWRVQASQRTGACQSQDMHRASSAACSCPIPPAHDPLGCIPWGVSLVTGWESCLCAPPRLDTQRSSDNHNVAPPQPHSPSLGAPSAALGSYAVWAPEQRSADR